ncbi:hypothetical protein MRX96_027167 [Rhipicephalus microplus]
MCARILRSPHVHVRRVNKRRKSMAYFPPFPLAYDIRRLQRGARRSPKCAHEKSRRACKWRHVARNPQPAAPSSPPPRRIQILVSRCSQPQEFPLASSHDSANK